MVETLVCSILKTYLAPYFSNFSQKNLQLSFFKGEVVLRQLIFNDKILDQFALPLKLKFGNLGYLQLKIPSYLNIAQNGLKIKIKNVFLCFEMLKIQRWNEETVINSYQNAKRQKLKRYENNVDMVYSHLQQQSSKSNTIELLRNIASNISIEIENVYVRFEDQNLKFSIGILIPRIEVQSMNKNWNLIETVIDATVLFKKLSVFNVDAYINYGDSFTPLNERLNLKAYKNIASLPKKQQEDLQKELSDYISETFAESSMRFSTLNKNSDRQFKNRFIFRNQLFSIDTCLQYTLNKKKALLENPQFNEPDIKLDMLFGGFFHKQSHGDKEEVKSAMDKSFSQLDQSKEELSTQRINLRELNETLIKDQTLISENPGVPRSQSNQNPQVQFDPSSHRGLISQTDEEEHFLSIVIDEQQLKAALHFMTFMACYSNYSQGVLRSKFYSNQGKKLTLERQNLYYKKYKDYRESKFAARKDDEKLHQELFDQFEADLRVDVIIMARDAETERFFGKKVIEDKYDMLKKNCDQSKAGQGFWQNTFNQYGGSTDQQILEQIEVLDVLQNAEVKDLEKRYEVQINRVRDLLQENIEVDKHEDEEGITQSQIQLSFKMPKVEIELFAIDQNDFKQVNTNKIPDFSCKNKNPQKAIAYMSFSGLSIKFSHQTHPVNHLLTIELQSLFIKDPQITAQVKQLNKKLPQNKHIMDSVIETRFQDQNQESESENKFKPQALESKLLSFKVKITSDYESQEASALNPFDKIPLDETVKESKRSLQLKTELKYDVDLSVLGKIIIYSNFAFVKRIMYLAGRISADIYEKRLFLINLVESDKSDKKVDLEQRIKIRQNIVNGFTFVKDLREYASKQMAYLQLKRLQQADRTIQLFNLSILAISPKLVIDEYLFGETVVNQQKPIYFLLDMGRLKIRNKVYNFNIESLGQGDLGSKLSGFYGSVDMNFVDLKILYSYVDIESLLDPARIETETFEVFEKFDFGIQYQQLMNQENEQNLPDVIVNLMLQQVRLNFDRLIINQLLQLKAFYFHGTFNQAKKFMTEQMDKKEFVFKKMSTYPCLQNKIKFSLEKPPGLQQVFENPAGEEDETIRFEKPQLSSPQKNQFNIPAKSGKEESMRVNILFTGMRLTKYKIDWETQRDNEMKAYFNTEFKLQNLQKRRGAEVEKRNSQKLETEQVLQLAADHLKIAVLMPNKSQMEVYVFLQMLTVTDLEHSNYHFKNLIVQPKKSLPIRKMETMIPKSKSGLISKLRTDVFGASSCSSQSSNSSQKMTPHKHASMFVEPKDKDLFQIFNRRSTPIIKESLIQLDSIDFKDFAEFKPRQEYEQNFHQVSVKYTSVTKPQKVTNLQKVNKKLKQQKLIYIDESSLDSNEELGRLEKSETSIKIKKIRFIALLSLVECIIQEQYNYLSDLNKSEINYQKHVEQSVKEVRTRMAKENEEKEVFVKFHKNNFLDADTSKNEKEEARSIWLSQITDSMEDNNRKVTTIQQTQKITIDMPEFQLSVPTNLLIADCLTLKINTGFHLERNVNCTRLLTEYFDSNEQTVVLKTKDELMEQKIQISLELLKLHMYLKDHSQQRNQKRSSESKEMLKKTFKTTNTNWDIYNLISFDKKDAAASNEKKALNQSIKSQIILPFDFVYQSESLMYTREKVLQKLCEEFAQDNANIPESWMEVPHVNQTEKIKQQAYGNHIGELGTNNAVIKTMNDFKLQLKLVEVRSYQQIIQLLLFYKNRIINLKPEIFLTNPLVSLTPVTNKSSLRPLNNLELSPSFKKEKTSTNESSQGLIYVSDLQRTRSLKNIKIDINGVVSYTIEKKEEDYPEISMSISEDSKNDPIQVKDQLSIEELIEQHTKQDEQSSLIKKLTKGYKLQLNQKAYFTTISFETNGNFQICLLDDVTQSYEESLLAFGTKKFSYNQSYISSNLVSLFQYEKHFDCLKQELCKFFKVASDTMFSKTLIQVELEASNFNHKSLDQEYLIEPYRLSYSCQQERPISQNVIKINSTDVLNINVTYGCLLSVTKALNEMKEEIKQKKNVENSKIESTKKEINQRLTRQPLDQIKEAFEDSDEENFSGLGRQISSELNSGRSQEQKFLGLKPSGSQSPAKQFLDRSFRQNLNQPFQSMEVSFQMGQLIKRNSLKKKSIGILDDNKFETNPKHSHIIKELEDKFINSDELRIAMDQLKNIDEERRKQLIPKFTFLNDLGKDVSFWISNEINLNELEKNEDWHTLEAGDYIAGDRAYSLNKDIAELLKSYKTDELKRAQLYINIKIEGYKMLQDFSLVQLGQFTFKLQPLDRKVMNSQYLVIHLVRNRKEIKVSFESHALVYNNTKETICMIAFNPNLIEIPQVVTCLKSKEEAKIGNQVIKELVADVYECEQHQVVILPITWFEKGYIVQISFASDQLKFQSQQINQDRVIQNFTIDKDKFMFVNGTIKQVLNPNITDPYQSHARVIKTEKGSWIGLEFALLDTRTNFGQFIMTFDYLSHFQNLLLTKIRIRPLEQKKIPEIENPMTISKVMNKFRKQPLQKNDKFPVKEIQSNQQQSNPRLISEESAVNNIKVFNESPREPAGDKYSFEPSQMIPIPELNLDNANDMPNEFELIFEADEENQYFIVVSPSKLGKLTHSKLLQFKEGTLLELEKKQKELKKSKTFMTSNVEPNNNISNNQQISITIVMEKLPGSGCLQDTEYNNFSLRRKIYHHRVCKVYQFYAPLIAVNLTKHNISLIQNHLKSDKTIQTLVPSSNLYINFNMQSHSKINIQIPGYSVSDKIDLRNLGVQGLVKMEKIHSVLKEKNQNSQTKIEVACGVYNAEQPYMKTRIIRIVQRYVFLNKLNMPVVINQIGQTEEVCIEQMQAMDFNFTSDNLKSQMRIRLVSRHDQLLKEEGDNGYFTLKQDESIQKKSNMDWSYTFSTQNIADFQIMLPKFEDYNTYKDLKDRKKEKRPWTNQKDNYFARITVTNDQNDQGKLFVIISCPRTPDFLFINYIDYPLSFQEKEWRKERKNKVFELKCAKHEESITPSATPFVLNPLIPNDINLLQIRIESHRFDKSKLLNEHHDLKFNIDAGGEKILSFKGFDGENEEVEMRTRDSGNMRIIEIYPLSHKKKIKQDKQKYERAEQKKDMGDQIHRYAETKNFEVVRDVNGDLVEQPYLIQENLQIIKLQGIGFSMVDFEPTELCYISLEGIVIENETCLYRKGSHKKTFSDVKLSLRNFQVDASDNQTYPILFGPLDPFRNIERQFKKQNGQKPEDRAKPFLKFLLLQTLENDSEIETKAIQEFKLSLADSEMQVHISFISQVQDMIFSFQALFQEQDAIWHSQILKNFSIIQELLRNDYKEGQHMFSQVQQKQDQKQNSSKSIVKYKHNLSKQDQTFTLKANSEVENRLEPKEKVCEFLNPWPDDQRANNQLLSYNKVFVEKIHIKAIKIVMSLRLRGIESILNQKGPLGFLLNLSSNFADISDAEFNFDELHLDSVHESQEALTNYFMSQYKQIGMQQFYQLFGSQDILGNPSSFIANLGRGAVELKNAPFEMLLEKDAKKAATGVLISVKGLLANTSLALTTSYSGLSGSIYLGIKNICGSGITHENLDKPLSVGGGFKKGGLGLLQELSTGVTGLYFVPQDRIRRQGLGGRQLAKGIGQGLLQLTTSPITSILRATYDLSTGVKNQISGKRYHGQRFRYPRHFDQNQRMVKYDPLYAHAYTALRIVNNGMYSKEIIHFAVDYSYMDKSKFFKDQVLMITNQSIMFIHHLKHIRNRVPLRQVRGLMIYFYEQKQNSINMELANGQIVKINTNMPEKNAKFLLELKKYLSQLSKQSALKQKKDEDILKQPKRRISDTNQKITTKQKLEERQDSDQSFEHWREQDQDSEEYYFSEESEESEDESKQESMKQDIIRTNKSITKVKNEVLPENDIASHDGVPQSLQSDEDNTSDYTYESYYEYE